MPGGTHTPDDSPLGDSTSQATGSDGLALQLPTLAFRESTPNPESFVIGQRVLQAFSAHSATRVDPPFSGKNASGSVCAHNACWCQANSSSAFTPNVQMSSILPPLWPKLHTCGSFASSPSGESACTGAGRTNPARFPNRSPPPGGQEPQGESARPFSSSGPPSTVSPNRPPASMGTAAEEPRSPTAD